MDFEILAMKFNYVLSASSQNDMRQSFSHISMKGHHFDSVIVIFPKPQKKNISIFSSRHVNIPLADILFLCLLFFSV